MSRDDADDDWSDTGWDDDKQGEEPRPTGPGADDDWQDDGWDDPDTLGDSEQLRLGELLAEGASTLASTTGVVLAALMTAMAVLSTVVTESLVAAWVEIVRDALTDPETLQQFEESGVSEQDVLDTLDGLGPFPLAFDLPGWLLLLGVLIPPFVAEAIRIVGVRAFAADELDGIPGELTSRRLLTATLLGWFGGTLLLIGLAIGFTLLVVPGVFLAIVTVFFRQEIAVADKGVIDSVRGSYALSKGHWMELFGLLVVLAILGFGLGFAVASVLPPSSVVSPLGSALVSGVMIVFAMAVVTEAYVQLGGGHEDERETMY